MPSCCTIFNVYAKAQGSITWIAEGRGIAEQSFLYRRNTHAYQIATST